MSQEKRKALGRGLESLLPARSATVAPAPPAPVAVAAEEGETVRQIPLAQIDRSPYQTRLALDEQALAELAASIAASGLVQPVVVRPAPGGRYQLIAGERRWLASERAGKSTVPAIVRQVSAEQAMEMTIVENLLREDLNAMEQARAFERLGREFALTQEQMAQRTGKDRTSIANYLRLLRMPLEVQAAVEKGALSFGHAKALMTLDDDPMVKVAARVIERGLSVRQTEALVFALKLPAERPQKPTRPQDPNVRQAERDLERALGLRVTIKDRKGRGKIMIEYATLDDFDRVVNALSKG